MQKLLACVAAVVVAVGVSMATAADDEAPKYKIKDVMKKAMKGGLCKKVASGGASEAEMKELVALFTALAAHKPPKGDAESWKAKTTALLSAAKDAAAGKDGADAALKKAANCGACHKAHKG